ncbi:dihydrodipicolinate synthase family protein [Actomonas aquatica]|uniref:Dihydrodipicolinate synthase family protein n=1 Tax=Actomonas aquatica TaxID=2866162 RepID=A0ABZ1CDV4_9BACT|nr:dihydrodipicolinate synthase family protein [Opitutus sp. WL0086]WRQ89597.1 dihydrodipicolinate synthase family protein [Opitutus sp. WL0086]
MTANSDPLAPWREHLLAGHVIPAHPLALDASRQLSERHQRALSRYYVDAGCGGIAVAVHSTQFEIRDPAHNLLEPVLTLASETIDAQLAAAPRPFIKIAGVCGRTAQARREATLARNLGYHAALLSLAAWGDAPEDGILAHCHTVAEELPLIGFYLQPAVGGRVFSRHFWSRFAEIENVLAIKIAPFNRYQTLDVVRAVIETGRHDIALYTGNDDTIVTDLLTPFTFTHHGETITRHISGGLLGHWGVWTHAAVRLLNELKAARAAPSLDPAWLARAAAVTDMNAALFDAANGFAGCIPGILEVLRRQGLVPTHHCLNPNEVLSPDQAAELDRVTSAYPDLTDDTFVATHLDSWLR